MYFKYLHSPQIDYLLNFIKLKERWRAKELVFDSIQLSIACFIMALYTWSLAIEYTKLFLKT